MKTIVAFVGLIALAGVHCASAQAPMPYNAMPPGPAVQYYPPGSMPMGATKLPAAPVQSGTEVYDHSYLGPYNAYGQPVYSTPTRQQAQSSGQLPPGYDGAVPQALLGLSAVGDYFWSFLPAPLRGVEDSPYVLGPDAGRTSVIFVPGYR